MLPSITWQWSLISFYHEIHWRVTRLTQLKLRIVDDSCDFLVVVGAYFWAMITHLISRNSFSRASLTVCVSVCVCVREKLAVRWPGGCQSALLSAAAVLGQLLSPFFAMQLTPLTPAPPTAQVFCPIAWQMAGRWLPPQVSVWVSLPVPVPVPVRVRRLQLRLRFGFRFLARAGPGWGHLVFKRLSTRPVQRVQSRVLLCFVSLLSSSCSLVNQRNALVAGRLLVSPSPSPSPRSLVRFAHFG